MTSALEQLKNYLQQVQQRLVVQASARALACSVGFAFVWTVALVWVANRITFAERFITPLRLALFLALLGVTAFLLLPLRRLKRADVVRALERRFPDFGQRLTTSTDGRVEGANSFHELLAEDTLSVAAVHRADHLAPPATTIAFLFAGMAASVGLVWLIVAAPGFWGYGASLLWTGHARSIGHPLYDIAVEPGNRTIRRKMDQVVTANLVGFTSGQVVLHAKFRNALKWEETPMESERGGSGYQFLFAALPDAVDYFVSAGTARSKQFTLAVKDLPAVKKVHVGLHFPTGLGLVDVSDDAGGDIRAVEGTEATITVETDHPLEHGVLVFDDGTKIGLDSPSGGGTTLVRAKLQVKKDGSYHVAVVDEGETIRLSDEFFVEAKTDEPPVVKIVRPVRDPHVSPIEELPVTVEATDDFGVNGLALHYAVNGGPEKTIPLTASGQKQATSKTTLYFENFKVEPGDVVSYYATAKDARHVAKTDIAFAQAEAWDYTFRQSQQAGGGGGGEANEGTEISERQKEVIAATWNQMRAGNTAAAKATVTDQAKFLSGMEGKLGEQAKTLADRMRSRELDGANPVFENFSKAMDQASASMRQAQEELSPGRWPDALTTEQKALQSLLRAESLFRDIQVAYGQSQGGGGGGGSNAGRDLARMLDLELDKSKNQYETGDSKASASEKQKAVDEAMKKLAELARRQQQLASEQKPQDALQQRWEQEMLRREAEQLRREMEQLAKNNQQPQQGQSSRQAQNGQSGQKGQQGQQGQGGQQSQGDSASAGSTQGGSMQAGEMQAGSRGGQSGRQSGQERFQTQALQRAVDSLEQAEKEMGRAAQNGNEGNAAKQAAANRLRESSEKLDAMQREGSTEVISDLARRAQKLAQQQQNASSRMQREYGAAASPEMQRWMNNSRFDPSRYRGLQPVPPTGKEQQLAAEKEELGDQVQKIEQQMQAEMQRLGKSSAAGKKLAKALTDAEQAEVAARMKKMADWIRSGYGRQVWQRDLGITNGMDELSRNLSDAEATLRKGDAGQGKRPSGQAGDNSEAARALQQIESMRAALEQEASQNGVGQGQGSGERSGQAEYGESGGGNPSGNPTLGQAADDLAGLRQQFGARDQKLRDGLGDASRRLNDLRFAKPGELEARLSREILPALERLELQLSRHLNDANTGARTSALETAPEKYRDAVAEYYRRLSK